MREVAELFSQGCAWIFLALEIRWVVTSLIEMQKTVSEKVERRREMKVKEERG